MKRRIQSFSSKGKIIVNKLDPGVFVVEIPETKRKISLGQPPDTIKRLQQVGYFAENAVDTFVLVDSKIQGDSISWVLVEFPLLYALYLCMVKVKDNMMPAFFAGKFPKLVGLESDVDKAMSMIKYGNYGIDSVDELYEMDIPEATADALKLEILGLAVGNEIKSSRSFINSVILDAQPRSEKEFSKLGDGISIGKIGYNTYRVVYKTDFIDVDVTLLPDEEFRSPVEYNHLKFPVVNFGIWHTGEYDGMDPYFSCAHTTIINKYKPVLIDYPSNMTDTIHHNGLSKQSINTIISTHNHDDHMGAMVELFRRTNPCQIITTEPVRHSLIKKMACLVNLPEEQVANSFIWTILPFRKDNPYQTETLNLDGLKITGHLSCHAVPTTVYTFEMNHGEQQYTYGHFLDIVAFKRMQMMVKDSWMPKKHYEHLDKIVRKQRYNLIKYDAGCASDAAVPFTVHGQWQDLKGAATERSFRLFTHVNKDMLDKKYESEGRFVRIGDLDMTMRSEDGRLIQFNTGSSAAIAFFYQAYHFVYQYFESLIDGPISPEVKKTIRHYAYIFSNRSKHADPNVGSFIIEQGAESDYVYIIIRGLAEIQMFNEDGKTIFRSSVGDGEVMGDIGVISGGKRMAAVKTLNRLSYIAVPANLFLEAINAMNLDYKGRFKEMFNKRFILQSSDSIGRDVSTNTLNKIARSCQRKKVKKGAVLYKKGDKDNRILLITGKAILKAGKRTKTIAGTDVIGECEFFTENNPNPGIRLHSATAKEAMDVIYIDPDLLREVPVIVDNIRRIICSRSTGIYRDIPFLDSPC